jgi:hypothetical protein
MLSILIIMLIHYTYLIFYWANKKLQRKTNNAFFYLILTAFSDIITQVRWNNNDIVIQA